MCTYILHLWRVSVLPCGALDLIQSSITLFEASDENRKKNLSDNETIHWWKLIELAFWVLGLIVEKESFES